MSLDEYIRKLSDYAALSTSLEKNNLKQNLSPEISRENIKSSLVRILRFESVKINSNGNLMGSFSEGNGLLLTNSGYIITADHVLKGFLPEWAYLRKRYANINLDSKEVREDVLEDLFLSIPGYSGVYIPKHCVVTNDLATYPLDFRFARRDPQNDLALIRASIPYNIAKPTEFKVDCYGVEKLDAINVMAYHDSEFKELEGRILDDSKSMKIEKLHQLKDVFITTALGSRGFSGGAIVNEWGELAGIVSFAMMLLPEKGLLGGIKSDKIITLVRNYCEELYEEILTSTT